jgi:hypothetical protein
MKEALQVHGKVILTLVSQLSVIGCTMIGWATAGWLGYSRLGQKSVIPSGWFKACCYAGTCSPRRGSTPKGE